MVLRSLVAFSLLTCLHDGVHGGLHDGPDPIGSWRLCQDQVKEGKLVSLLGVDARIEGKAQFVADKHGGGMLFDGKSNCIVLADDFAKSQQKLPKKHMTATAWVAVNTPVQWGGVIGCVQDNGDAEAGWVLGYDQHHFTFGLASKGADDGDGKITYLAGKTRYELGRYYHVCGTYDGKVQRIYVNGRLDGESKVQSGALLYAKSAPLVIGAYRDRNENTLHHGRIHSVRIFDETAKPKAVKDMFTHGAALTKEQPHVVYDPELKWLVHPYLQWATTDGMTVRWESSGRAVRLCIGARRSTSLARRTTRGRPSPTSR